MTKANFKNIIIESGIKHSLGNISKGLGRNS